MNIYQITLNHSQVYVPSIFQDLITKDPEVNAWWNYLPNIFLVRTNQPAKYFADKLIASFPGVGFLITKLDMNEYNGYLPQNAWDWIKAHSPVKPLRITPNPLAPTYGSALRSILNQPALKPKTDFDLIKAILDRAKKS